jgi:hypothetical protein
MASNRIDIGDLADVYLHSNYNEPSGGETRLFASRIHEAVEHEASTHQGIIALNRESAGEMITFTNVIKSQLSFPFVDSLAPKSVGNLESEFDMSYLLNSMTISMCVSILRGSQGAALNASLDSLCDSIMSQFGAAITYFSQPGRYKSILVHFN